MRKLLFLFIGLSLIGQSMSKNRTHDNIRGWTILSNSYSDAIKVIDASKNYNINHLQLSHELIMDLREIKNEAKSNVINSLIDRAHSKGIKEVVLWDHSLYELDYYPKKFRTGPDSTLNFDNKAFWEYFKNDYREMMKIVPNADGLVLTFIETGARTENQYSELLKTGPEKLAYLVDAVASVVCNELHKKLYIRTFAYSDAEYANTIGCIKHIKNKNVILMMKETPHDFFLTHPNDKYAGTIDRPTIMEFDTGNEFNGQGEIANTWVEYVTKRWRNYMQRDHIIGYVARTDRYGDTRLVGKPNEILLYALKRTTEQPSITDDEIYNEFIINHYGEKALTEIKAAFKLSFDIVTSTLYTLGTNTANHSALNYDPYTSSYGRHVSGKWLSPPIVFVGHDVNRQFNYWKDIIQHIAPAKLKSKKSVLMKEAPYVLTNNWITDKECMTEEYLKYIIAEKKYGVEKAQQALLLIEQTKTKIDAENYNQLYQLFYRTLLTAQLHSAVATAYWGYRIYTRGGSFITPELTETIHLALNEMKSTSQKIENYTEYYPIGQWNWKDDAKMARQYYDWITLGTWKEYNYIQFKY
ncbi:MAG: hypothetical protein GZ091_08130 [Paludibacter sp.]|nr:hypothetical protein [Paludibacter sp.]